MKVDARTRNIVVGIIFVAAILIIFVPMLFDKPVHITTEINDFENPEIELPDLTVEEPSVDALREAGEKLASKVDEEGFSTETGVRVGEPELSEEQPETNRWAVQLASFSSEARAQSLVERCIEAGDQAWMSVAKVDGQRVHRVAVGPFMNRNEAETQLSNLKSKYDIEPIIVSYQN